MIYDVGYVSKRVKSESTVFDLPLTDINIMHVRMLPVGMSPTGWCQACMYKYR